MNKAQLNNIKEILIFNIVFINIFLGVHYFMKTKIDTSSIVILNISFWVLLLVINMLMSQFYKLFKLGEQATPALLINLLINFLLMFMSTFFLAYSTHNATTEITGWTVKIAHVLAFLYAYLYYAIIVQIYTGSIYKLTAFFVFLITYLIFGNAPVLCNSLIP